MSVYKSEDNISWYVMTRYTNYKGERKQKCKRGFATKREAQEWERSFNMQKSADMDMTFEDFFELYKNDKKSRVKENTWLTKEYIINLKILPYFAKRKISEITAKDVIDWQNQMLAYRDENKKPYSQTYLKTLHNQLSAIFNHAVRYYELSSNPAAKAGNMGTEERAEMLFWTKEEYQKFSDVMMDKPIYFYAFEMLYWCGIRVGELLALTPADFDFEKSTVTLTPINLLENNTINEMVFDDKQKIDDSLRVTPQNIIIKRISPSFVNYIDEIEDDVYAGGNLILINNISINPKYLSCILNKKMSIILLIQNCLSNNACRRVGIVVKTP